jgi:hypothetical protein
MAEFTVGKGVYIWQPETIEGGNPESIAARLQLAGVQTAAIKICDGFQVLDGHEVLFQTLRNHQISVGAWGYSYLTRAPFQEAHAVADACHRYTPDFYLIDVEAEVEGNHGGVRMFMNELRPATAGLPLGLNSFWNTQLHPDFPWADFMKAVDFVCPMIYWRGDDPVGKLIESQQSYGQIPDAPEIPMSAVAGDLYTHNGVQPTTSQVLEFLSAADSDPFIGGVVMWAADDTQTTPELWQAYSAYQWKKGGRTIPDQPMGWAKVKAPRGLWVRSSPKGSKVGGLAKGELAPVWTVTDTKWAAINQSADRWIYIGEPLYVETTLNVTGNKVVVPSSVPELFQARVVPWRGLNVRDAIGGRVLRALPCNTVVRVYEEQSGWARVHPLESQWVSAAYLRRITEPAYA